MVEITYYKTTAGAGHYFTTVQEKLTLIFQGHETKILCRLKPEGVSFVTKHGISENDRVNLEKLIQGLVGWFGAL
jgi:hypothetical protein